MSCETNIVLEGGVQVTPEEAAKALWEAMQIIESVGTTGIYDKGSQAKKWMERYFPNWAD